MIGKFIIIIILLSPLTLVLELIQNEAMKLDPCRYFKLIEVIDVILYTYLIVAVTSIIISILQNKVWVMTILVILALFTIFSIIGKGIRKLVRFILNSRRG